MKKIVTVLGARPQFIKAAVLSRIIKEKGGFIEVIVHTGQHFDKNMSEVFFEEMMIPIPNYNLDINSGTHGAMTGRMLEKIEEVLMIEKPDAVLVYGDTNSTLAGALAAKKLYLKVIHVEAGLRSFNMDMPEEVNRILTDRISDLLICPTDVSVKNLQSEGITLKNTQVHELGDIMKDAVGYYSNISISESSILENLELKPDNYALATVHRQENTDEEANLRAIINALEFINSDIMVVLPLHPRTAKKIEELGITPNMLIIDPVGYLDMQQLIQSSKIVLTDSGGLQKEAYFHQKYCIVLREETEWVELVDNNFAILVGSDFDKIKEAFKLTKHKPFNSTINLFGDNVGEKIYNSIIQLLN